MLPGSVKGQTGVMVNLIPESTSSVFFDTVNVVIFETAALISVSPP